MCLCEAGYRRRRVSSNGVLPSSSVLLAVCAVVAVLLAGCGSSGEPAPARVTIETEPEGARILARGEERGVSPVTLTGLDPGAMTVVAQKEGYKSAHDSLTLQPGADREVKLSLEPEVGFISVRSEPEGAEVILDGEKVLGKTPLERERLQTGEYSYEVRHEDYLPSTKDFEVKANYSYDWLHKLTPREAELTVYTRPTSAAIYINEEPQTDSTPARFSLRPGTYTVAVVRGGYLRKEQVVTLGPNDEEKIELQLEPGEEPPGMVLIPEGTFLFGLDKGAPDEAPQREIFLDAYYIDRTEVTNAQFKEIFPDHSFSEGDGNYPVTGVTFMKASEYAEKAGKRLPTEAEWEKAARGTDGRLYPWGDQFDKERCNVEASDIGRPTRCGSFPLGASPFRVLDMAGNAYEWTSDWYKAYPGNTEINKDYGQIYRVLRGGSYLSRRYDARCVRRHFDRMDVAREDYGFRCVMDLPENPEE
ncbi:MAG: SUMF1/EgtB/PvdO family nonheme iron enzyme [Candidatus Hydrogenedentota bacterium]